MHFNQHPQLLQELQLEFNYTAVDSRALQKNVSFSAYFPRGLNQPNWTSCLSILYRIFQLPLHARWSVDGLKSVPWRYSVTFYQMINCTRKLQYIKKKLHRKYLTVNILKKQTHVTPGTKCISQFLLRTARGFTISDTSSSSPPSQIPGRANKPQKYPETVRES